MSDEAQELGRMHRKRIILEYAKGIGNCYKACREFNVNRSTFYNWKKTYEKEGFEGLRRKKPIHYNYPGQIPQETINRILELRQNYQLGSKRITWYLERYHGIKISESSVPRTLVRNGLNRLSKATSKRTLHTKRYAKKVPGHQVQVDVKFAFLLALKGIR